MRIKGAHTIMGGLMWGVTDESSENPLAELWGLFKRDDDVSWQHKALCSQTDPEAFFPDCPVQSGLKAWCVPCVHLNYEF